MFKSLLILALCVASSYQFGRKQRVKTAGKFFCPSNPEHAANITIKMIEKDAGPDDHMAQTHAEPDGSFTLEGEESELSRIDAHLHIYHNCNDVSRIGVPIPCARKWDLKIPERYINTDEVFDLGRLNLEMIMKDEEHDCLH